MTMQISGVTIQGGMNILPAGGSPSPSGPTDPNFSDVELLLNGDGTNGSTSFPDLSSNSHTISVVGNTQVNTSTKKFGTGAIEFDGTGDELVAPSNSNLALGSGNFTVECWIYPISNSFYNGIYQNNTDGNGAAGALRITTNNSDQTSLQIATAATGLIYTPTGVVTANDWNHIALVRNGSGSNNLTIYVNGVSQGSVTNTTDFSDGLLQIGNAAYGGTDYFFNGLIDEFRITKGVARYTSNFTAPSSAFPTS